MNFQNTITNVFIQTSTAYKNRLEKKLGNFGLHSGQIFVLISLWDKDGQSQNELTQKLLVSSPTVNKMVKSLTKSGFVQCQPSKEDGRVVRVFLTEKSVGIKPEIEKVWMDLEQELQTNLTEPEKLILQQIMEKTRQNLVS